MVTKSEILVQEFVLFFGFLGGLFTYFGVNQDEQVIRPLLETAIPSDGFLLSFVIILIGIAITIIGVLGIYADAGKLGLLVVGCAYISGLIMPSRDLTVIGAFLLIGAVLLGPVVYDAHNN